MKRIAVLALLLAGCATEVAVVDVYRSRETFIKRETEDFLSDHSVDDVAALEQVWTEVGQNYPQPPAPAGPLLQTALVEVARNRAEKLYHASLPAGKSTAAKDGAYYLAMAEASRVFADSIPVEGRRETPPDRDQLRAALQTLEREAYRQFERDPSRHAVVFSAKLNEARELLDRGSLAGATLTLLEAKRDASPAARGHVEVTENTTLHSAFRENPAALSLLDAMTARTLPVAAAENAPVTVTLVRWPFACSLSDPASLLTQEIVRRFGGQVRLVVQDFGASPLAERFGVERYPAVFVDDTLVARPEDFHEWGGASAGRYLPWRDPEQRKEFQHDLARTIDLRLAGAITLLR